VIALTRSNSSCSSIALNTNPKWTEGSVAALREAGAQEKMIPFLMTWVRRFFAQFPGSALESRPDDVLQITPSPTSAVPSWEQGRSPAADG
jgi:hypothetical protein